MRPHVSTKALSKENSRIPRPSILLIEGSDFQTFPVGGQLSMARALMAMFGNTLALVGISREDGPTGCWIQKEISGIPYLFFPVSRKEPSGKRPLIPARLSFYTALRGFEKEIFSLTCKAAFIQAPEALLAVSNWGWDSLSYWFAGVENPLKISRYQFARPFWRVFDKAWFSALERTSVVFAAADERAICSLVSRSRGLITRERVIQLPTCVDTCVFQPEWSYSARAALGIPQSGIVFVTVGRISKLKGWELLLEAFERFHRGDSGASLYFVGDGEERSHLETQIEQRDLTSSVKITGFVAPSRVAHYLNAATLVIFGSFVEGWSVAMLEALACGKPIVSTEVSGVREIIKDGQNGFVVENRSASDFAKAMINAVDLPHAGEISRSVASRFAVTRMRETLTRAWEPFRTASL